MDKGENKIVVSLDCNIEDGEFFVDELEQDSDLDDMIYGYKLGSFWILDKGLGAAEDLYDWIIVEDHKIVLDMHKWPTDIPVFVDKQVKKVAQREVVNEMIACPMGSGRKSLEAFVWACVDADIRPLCVLEMTHPESDSYLSKSYQMKILSDAALMGVDGYVIPATKEPKLDIKKFLSNNFPSLNEEYYATGFGYQKGNIDKMKKFGVSRFIIGRSIYESDNPAQSIIDIYNDINGIVE